MVRGFGCMPDAAPRIAMLRVCAGVSNYEIVLVECENLRVR
jgi:hypothetical protein